ncbi:MAG: SpoIIE family protein phosphatase, partial [Longispora sp.]|nr:SpoIIE family protein phosphatase [Longispora sp. (in: high G+C Gram-positive bacteria)]
MPTHVRRRFRLPPNYESPAHARAAVREVLAEAGLAELLDEALLLTTELATNGVVHAGTDIEVDVVVDDAGVTVTVTDFDGSSIEPMSQPDYLSEGGRGLVLVDQFASAWGTTHGEGSKGVWFRLDRSPVHGQQGHISETSSLPAAPPQRLDWLSFLSETSELLAQSLDAELTLALIPQLVVPRLGDWCAVHTADQSGTLILATWLHRDEPSLPLLRDQLREAAPRLHDVVATRAPVMLPRPCEGVTVPLVARDQLLGTLSVGRHIDHLHNPDEVAVITDLARRAALAIENARIHAERESIAQAFQRALLPAALPRTPGIDLGAEYVPAGAGTEVGGDFYDVMPIEHNRWLLSIGDVCGKGARAAALTGLVRDVVRVLVRDGCPLPRAMRLLNTTMLERGEGKHCTLAAGLVSKHPDGRVEVRLCLAGHDKPVLLRANGETELVGLGGTAVGLLDSVYTPLATVLLSPGDVLVFYTDGITERRHGEELYGQDRLCHELSGLVGLSASAVAARLRAAALAFSAEVPRDDIALLVLRNPLSAQVPSGGMTALPSSLSPSDHSVPAPGVDTPPVAKRIPSSRTQHGDTTVDEYAWLLNK